MRQWQFHITRRRFQYLIYLCLLVFATTTQKSYSQHDPDTQPSIALNSNQSRPTPSTAGSNEPSIHTGSRWLEILGLLGLGGFLSQAGAEAVRLFLTNRRDAANAKKESSLVVARNLEPILVSAEELVSKINWLAKTDFKEFETPHRKSSIRSFVSLTYYIFRFAAQLEALRLESQHINLTDNDRGSKLLQFVRVLESPGIRLLGRDEQRMMAESCLRYRDGRYYCITLAEYENKFQTDDIFRMRVGWIDVPKARNKEMIWRHRLIKYGIVVLALTDELDPAKRTTRNHRAYWNKIPLQDRRYMRYGVFERSLDFIHGPVKYDGLGCN